MDLVFANMRIAIYIMAIIIKTKNMMILVDIFIKISGIEVAYMMMVSVVKGLMEKRMLIGKTKNSM